MSQKSRDEKNRWRNKMVAFRMSQEEADQLDVFIKLSGINKQKYLISRVLQREIIVQGNPRTYKALRNQLAAIQEELQSFSSTGEMSDELIQVISQIAVTLEGLKNE